MTSNSQGAPPSRWYNALYFHVLIAILIGAFLGNYSPALAVEFKLLGDIFVKLIKMVIGPIIFVTIVVGIAEMGDLKRIKRIGFKALLYFEVLTTLALIIGYLVVKYVKPGEGINANIALLDSSAISQYQHSPPQDVSGFILNLIPHNIIDAFAHGDILQILFFSILFGLSLATFHDTSKPIIDLLQQTSKALLGIVGMVMKLAPLAAFGSMAFTIGKYGIQTLWSLGKLLACVYLTCGCFIFIVLVIIAWFNGFNLWSLLVYLKEEILIVLGTSSSESALPQLMTKMEHLGCSKSVVGLVLPAGYSFNLDGTSIYLTMAALFIAQATNTSLTFRDEFCILGLLLVTSKGSAAVSGGGFITLAATLSSFGKIPVAGLALILGVDRFMSEARAITNLIGNSVAMIVIAKSEGELDHQKLKKALHPHKR